MQFPGNIDQNDRFVPQPFGLTPLFLENPGSATVHCCDMGQNDTISKIELILTSVLSENNTNYKNDIHKFSNSLSDQESTEDPINTYRC